MENNIYKKLNVLQQSYNSTKDQKNNFANFNYRNVENILTDLKPILNSLGLTLIFNEEIINGNNADYIKFECKLIDVETGESVNNISVCGIDTELKGMSKAQMVGADLSYGRKYCLGGLLLFSTGVADPDSMDNTKLNNKPKTTENKVSDILQQISECQTIEELTDLWNRLKSWTKNETIKTAFTTKKQMIKNG